MWIRGGYEEQRRQAEYLNSRPVTDKWSLSYS